MSPAPAEAAAPLPSIEGGDAIIYAFQRNVVVAASAGTGKTHRLTALYVLLTLGLTSVGQPDSATAASPVLPDRIVATTFSRAAAGEIAHRIERSLREIAEWDGQTDIRFADILRARRAALSGSPGVPTIAELRKRAAEALARLPASRIDTLHGVAKQIVDRHAVAMGLTPGARILDEEEAQSLSDLAVDEALSRALADGGGRADAARALIAAAGGVDAARSEVTRLLDRLDEEGLTPRRLALTDHGAEADALRRELHRLAAESAALGGASFREPAASLAAALGRADPAGPLPGAAIAPLLDLLTLRKPHKSKCTPADEALTAFREALPGETHRDKAQHLLGFLREAHALRGREAMIVDVLEEIRERLATIRRTEGGLGFGDLLRAARDGLRDDPAIGRAVRESIDVLLVDEFQDTSAVQRDLVYLLREREDAAASRAADAVPAANGIEDRGLFLVGDRKQSIYGFRGADVSIFCRVCAELAGAAAGRALELPEASWSPKPIADFVALRESRRSTPEVLAFINAFSSRDFAQGRSAPVDGVPTEPLRDFEIAYGAAEQLVAAAPVPASPSDGAPTTTRVVLVADAGGAPGDGEERLADDAPGGGDAALVREAKGPLREALLVAAYIARRVRVDGGDLRFRDVAVLARRRSTIPLIELALARLDVPYVVAGRALYDAPEIRDVAAILRLLLDPRDRLALATVLRGPMVALSDTALAILSPPGRGLTVPLFGRWPHAAHTAAERRVEEAPPDDADIDDPHVDDPHVDDPHADDPHVDSWPHAAVSPLSRLPPADRAHLEAFRARFSALRRAALRCTPGEAIRAALCAFDLDRVIAALPRAQARIGNIDRLVAIARRRGGSLASFVRWLERRIHDEADEPEAAVFSPEDDAVRLTTIHASKGLDFPCVLVVDLNAEPRADQPGIGFVPGSSARGRPATLLVRHHARRVDRAQRPGSLYDAEVEALAPMLPITPPAIVAARAEVRARERAERQRLTYVAITRARSELVLIGTDARARGASAWATLKTGVDSGPLAETIGATLDGRALLAEAKPPTAGTDAYARPVPAARVAAATKPATARTLAIAAAPLAMFHACPRRFRLRHLLGIDEPAGESQLGLFDLDGPPELPGEERVPLDDGADPRPPGRAPHRVLERWPRARWGEPTVLADVLARLAFEGLAPASPDTMRIARGLARFLEGPYARRAGDEAATLRREVPFAIETSAATIDVEGAARADRRDRSRQVALALEGAIDLYVEHADGTVDVVDYKRAKPRADLSPYEFRLRAAALAARRRHPDRPIRAGVLFLGAEAAPVWLEASGDRGALSEDEHAGFERLLVRLAERLATAQSEGRFDGIPPATCRRLRCGFIDACHASRKPSP